jgi:HAE1 family hydrophobic/amphiphilic exporter-1
MIGRFFFEYGLAISFAVAVSLLIAVTLTPMLCSRVLVKEASHGAIFRSLEFFYERLERGYGVILAAALRHRLLVVAVAVASVVIGIAFGRGIPLEFGGKVDRAEFEGLVELPLGAGIEETKLVSQRVAAALRAVPDVDSVFLTVGAGSRQLVNIGNFYVALTPKQQRENSDLEVMERARKAMTAAAPEAKTVSVNEIPWVSGGGFTAFNMEYALQGPDLWRLDQLADTIAARMRQSPLFVDTKTSFDEGKPEIQVLIDRQRAADLAVPVRNLATTVRALIGGLDVASFEEGGSRYDVRIRLEERQRDEVNELGRIQVRAVNGALVDLANVARFRIERGPARVERRDRARMVLVYANTPEGVAQGSAADRLDEIVAEVGLPSGYWSGHRGQTERMRESAESVQFAFLLALVALYMILASQFNSFAQPAVIMFSAPLSFVGAFAALKLSGTYMSIFAQIGLVALMGLVMKNGILLVDYANRARSEGRSAREAMLEAGPIRLRPVLMTAFSTIFAMIPVAISRSDGSEWRSPMGILVIGGLFSSTFLTLLVVPVIYTLSDDLRVGALRLGARIGSLSQLGIGRVEAMKEPAPVDDQTGRASESG